MPHYVAKIGQILVIFGQIWSKLGNFPGKRLFPGSHFPFPREMCNSTCKTFLALTSHFESFWSIITVYSFLFPLSFQFITLPRSDEKSRLIPVLSTILKLSPVEIESIQKVIALTASDSSLMDSESTSGAGGQASEVGWTSYLGLWST